jgi:deoxyadenosine/deoxycytidine kinase
MEPSVSAEPRRLRVVIVGPCASGKSTLAERLRADGYDAYVCAQEHSEISNLWQHLEPEAVIALDVDLDTVRRRRGAEWPETIFREQIRRLAAARSAANVTIDAAALDRDAVERVALEALSELT